jgi:signal transduction histidine kinase
MTQAVKNERLAVKQKLAELCRKPVEEAAEQADKQWVRKFPVSSGVKNFKQPFYAFRRLTAQESGNVDGALIFNPQGQLVYPAFAEEGSDIVEMPKEFVQGQRLELVDKNYVEALHAYQAVEYSIRAKSGKTKDYIRIHCLLGKLRCYRGLNELDKAVEICASLESELSLQLKKPECRLELARLYFNTLLQSLELRKADTDILKKAVSQANNLSEFGNTTIPSELRIHFGQEVLKHVPESVLKDTESSAYKLNKLIEAEILSLDIAERYDDLRKITEFTARQWQCMESEQRLYACRYEYEGYPYLLLLKGSNISEEMDCYKEPLAAAGLTFRITDDKKNYVCGLYNPGREPVLTSSLGEFFPDWQIEVFLEGSDILTSAADRQIAIYTWAAILMVLFILATGGLAAGSIGRQIKLNRLKNDFIATVSHELKTPLSSMRVLVDTLLEGNYKDQSQATEYLQLICKENERLSRLIDNFLTFSRMERNKRAFEMVRIEPREISKGAVEAVRTKLDKRNCELDVSIEPNLPPVFVDKDAMVTALVNLLDNACKYSLEEKRIKLAVSAENSFVNFSVTDNGIGMSHRVAKKIFNRFYQADQSLSRKTEGCGLGLSIVKFIVDTHKGRITVESEPGKGTTFTVRLSAVTEEQ